MYASGLSLVYNERGKLMSEDEGEEKYKPDEDAERHILEKEDKRKKKKKL